MTTMCAISELSNLESAAALEVIYDVGRKYGDKIKPLKHIPVIKLLGILHKFAHWRVCKAPLAMYTSCLYEGHGSVSNILTIILTSASDTCTLADLLDVY